MPAKNRYLFDSDGLIVARNLYYKPEFCPGFWSWLEEGHQAGVFFSIDKVKSELLGGSQPSVFADWIKKPEVDKFFVDSMSALSKWQEISAWANFPGRNFTASAKQKFLSAESADAWLVAYAAKEEGITIVTNEVAAPESKTSIKVPDAAAALAVPTISLVACLALHAVGNFKFSN